MVRDYKFYMLASLKMKAIIPSPADDPDDPDTDPDDGKS